MDGWMAGWLDAGWMDNSWLIDGWLDGWMGDDGLWLDAVAGSIFLRMAVLVAGSFLAGWLAGSLLSPDSGWMDGSWLAMLAAGLPPGPCLARSAGSLAARWLPAWLPRWLAGWLAAGWLSLPGWRLADR